jgi:1-aminocyclopropane-1-carboxylate deaminase/D-cysteine desulfhydrase-like pyridoxal-dependent ACC family enzyme
MKTLTDVTKYVLHLAQPFNTLRNDCVPHVTAGGNKTQKFSLVILVVLVHKETVDTLHYRI